MKLIPLLVYRPGTEVVLSEKLKGEIISVHILANNHIQYKVSWWNGNERKEEWLEAFQLADVPEEQAISIGFK